MYTPLRRPVLVSLAVLAGLALLLWALAGCVPAPLPTPVPAATAAQTPAEAQAPVAMANPASVYCDQKGYKVQIRRDAAGNQYGICVLSAGGECDEWAFFRHECGQWPGGASATVTATLVITYTPPLPALQLREGTCFSSSLAVWRVDAWRCQAESEILDPCFGSGGPGDSLLCTPDPSTGAPGFPLRLTQALPEPELPQDTANHAWLIELADGTVCGFATGATGGVGDKRINYLCRSADPVQRVAILGDLQAGTVWTAERGVVVAGDQGTAVKETTTVSIRRVWR